MSVVPPNLEKLSAGPKAWYAENWKAAYRKIQQASHIVFLGYSLPATDYQVGLTIHTALAHNHGLKRAWFVTKSNKEEFKTRINTLLSKVPMGHYLVDNDRVHFLGGGYEGLLEADNLPACLQAT